MAGHVNRSSLLRIDAICKQVGIYSGGSSSSGFFNSNLSVDLLADGDVYQFGVYEGLSLRTISRIVHPLRLFAFDSIAGLPEDTHDELKIDKWAPGTFETTQQRIHQKGIGHAELIPGYFNQSLTSTLARTKAMRPAVYVDIVRAAASDTRKNAHRPHRLGAVLHLSEADPSPLRASCFLKQDSDLYVSAKEALFWLFSQRLLVPGSVVGYDDYWAMSCAANDTDVEAHGEARAHLQASRHFGARWRCVCGPCVGHQTGRSWGGRTYFALEGVNQRGSAEDSSADIAQVDSGFHMTETERRSFMSSSKYCSLAGHALRVVKGERKPGVLQADGRCSADDASGVRRLC